MLNKQGLFSRNTPSPSPATPNSRPIPGSLSVNSHRSDAQRDEEFVMPGHLAAIESATTASSSAPHASPSHASSQHAAAAAPAVSASATPAGLAESKLNDSAKAAAGSKLIVGPDVKLKGAEILDCDTLVVEGRVEATMDSRVIQIAEKGAFSGKVGIDVAEIYGQFDGELTARGQLIIHASGRVSGKIRYGKIHIEEGGELSGDIASITAESSKPAARPNLNS